MTTPDTVITDTTTDMNSLVPGTMAVLEWDTPNITGISIDQNGILTNTLAVGTEVSTYVRARNAQGWGQSQIFVCKTIAAGQGTDLTQLVASFSMRVEGNSISVRDKYGLNNTQGAGPVFSDPPPGRPLPGVVQRCYREDLVQGQTNYGFNVESNQLPYSKPDVAGSGSAWPTPQYPSSWSLGYGLPSRYSEMWFRARVFYETGFNFDNSQNYGPALKWFRPAIHPCTPPQGSNLISNRNFMFAGPQTGDSGGSTVNTIRIGGGEYLNPKWPDSELNSSYWPFPGGSTVKIDQWYVIEVYLKLDTLDKDSGGEANHKLWIDGDPIGEISHLRNMDQSTWDSEGGYSLRLLWGQNWNGDVPRSQPMYLSDLAWAYNVPGGRDDTQYMMRDVNGFPMIGPDAIDTRT
jgi:hypothetical protein